MNGRNNFNRAMLDRSQRQPKKNPRFSGFLGIRTGGVDTVDIASRPGFVWVRLRNVDNEVIQAFNEDVSSIYNLPVLVERDLASPTRYKVVGRDIGVYGSNWGTASPYLTAHAGQHSFNKEDNSTGGDIAWIYTDQFLPFLVSPSGTAGAGNVLVFPGIYHKDEGTYHYAGDTGTASIIGNNPTGANNARMSLVYLDTVSGNLLIENSTTEFASTITGTASVLPYIPAAPLDGIALAGVRLVTGTSAIVWENLTDLREFVHEHPGAGAGETAYAWISVSAVRAAGAKPATIGLNGNGWIVASFADGQEQQIQANLMIPSDCDTSEDINVCLGWSSPTISQDCDWEVTYIITKVDDDTDQAGTTLQSYEESSAVSDGLTRSTFVVAAANIDSDDICIHLIVERDGNDGSDNLGAVAELHGIALGYITKN